MSVNLRSIYRSAPATTVILGLLIAAFLGAWISRLAFFDEFLPLRTGEVASQPWTLITYPFFQASEFIWFVVLVFWLYSIGGSVERDLGSKRFLIFWLVSSIIGALLFILGCAIASQPGALLGSLLPVSAVTIYWCAKNPSSEVRLFLVLPISAQLLGWITAGIVLFDLGRIHPLVGVSCVFLCVLSYFFALGKIPVLTPQAGGSRKAGPRGKFYSEAYYEDAARRSKEREEKERLRRLLEGDPGPE